MADWKAECSSDSECENLFMAIGEQFRTRDLVQVLSSVRDKGTKLECMRNVKRKKLSKKVNVVRESLRQEHDIERASDTTPTDMRSPLSAGSSRELQHAYQQQRFTESCTPIHLYTLHTSLPICIEMCV